MPQVVGSCSFFSPCNTDTHQLTWCNKWLPKWVAVVRFSARDQSVMPMCILYLRWNMDLECSKISLSGKVPPYPLISLLVASDRRRLPNLGESWMAKRWDHFQWNVPAARIHSSEHCAFITRFNYRIRVVLWASLDHTCEATYLNLGV